MRARLAFGMMLTGLGIAAAACLPEVTQDFDDYQARARAFKGPVAATDAGPTIEAGPPPTEAVNGLYVASCLTELANGSVSRVFTFYTKTAFTPSATGGKLDVTLQAMALVNNKPPTLFSQAGTVGAPLPTVSGTTDANGSFTITVPPGVEMTFPGAANPISGSDVALSNAGLAGRFATARWCARLNGHVDQPAAAARTLDESKNFCIFVAAKDGDPVPTYEFTDFSEANCPL